MQTEYKLKADTLPKEKKKKKVLDDIWKELPKEIKTHLKNAVNADVDFNDIRQYIREKN